jgi:CBS domain-containing protein
MMGGALGSLEAGFLPYEGAGFWPLVSMGAILGGTMRSPFTGVIFALELTHDVNMLLPLLLAVSLAHGFTVLTLRRSILTEKVARRGYHLSREYAVDPLEIQFVREVMHTDIVALPASVTCAEAAAAFDGDGGRRRSQLLYPVVDESKSLVGAITQRKLSEALANSGPSERPIAELAETHPVVGYADEPLRVVVYRMAETGRTRLPVVESAANPRLVGMISLNDLLRARRRALEEERHRERVLRIHLPFRRRHAAGEGPGMG